MHPGDTFVALGTMTALGPVTLGGCRAWDGRECGTNLTEAMGAAMVFSLRSASPAPLGPCTFVPFAHGVPAIGAIWIRADTCPSIQRSCL